MNNSLSPVTFHGDTIFCFTYQNQPYTAMKPIIENMGLDWRSQAAKLRSNKERWGVAMFTTPTSSGDQEMVCMPVRKLPAFLNTINPKKVRPELRERIELYQAESDDVLWEYWTNQQALRSMPDPCLSVEDRRPLSNLIAKWAGKAKMSFPDCWRELHSVFSISTVAELPATMLPAALAWVQAKIDALEARRAPELPTPSPAPSWPLELADYAMKGNGQPVNFWKELKQAESILKGCASAVALACHSGSLMYMTPEKHLFHRILSQSADHAAASIMMALQDVNTCLSVKHKIDFFKS